MKTTLVICCKNEEHTITSVIADARTYVDQIIVVDGHSTDASYTRAVKANAQVILDDGKGKGTAIQCGIHHAIHDIIVFMDADGSHEASDIPLLIRPIVQNKATLVIASRGKGGSDELHGTFEKTIRMIGSAIITQIINWRFHTRITDSQNGFRAIKTSVAKRLHLTESSFAIEQDMLIRVLKKHGKVMEIASHELERKHGSSKIALRSMWWRYLWNLCKNCLS